jgi:hypothetical protein
MRLVVICDGGLAQRLWRVLDAVDYWVMQARLWRADALYGPEPETEADLQRGCDREDLWRLPNRVANPTPRPIAPVGPDSGPEPTCR